MQQDLHSEIDVKRIISPVRQTNSSSAIVGQIIDLANAAGCEIVIQTGALTDTNATFAATLEAGDASNLSDAAAVAASEIVGAATVAAGLSFTFSDDDAVKRIGYIGAKRYIRLTITPTGNDAGNLDVSAFAILSGQRKKPVA